jgi:hypothetical protein
MQILLSGSSLSGFEIAPDSPSSVQVQDTFSGSNLEHSIHTWFMQNVRSIRADVLQYFFAYFIIAFLPVAISHTL